MSIPTTATIVTLLGLRMLNSPLDTVNGYDNVYFVYNSQGYNYQSDLYQFSYKEQEYNITRQLPCNDFSTIIMYKPSNFGFARNDTNIDCSQVGSYSLVVRDENFFNRNQYRLTFKVENRPAVTT